MKVLQRSAAAHRIQASNALFSGMDLRAMGCVTVSYRRGDAVLDLLEGVPCVGVVASGLVDVFSVSHDGSTHTVSTLREGDAFGICNIFAAQPMPTSLRCRREAQVVFLTKERFSALLQQDSTLLMRYLTLCNEKMQFLATRVELVGMASCRGKLIGYLSRSRDTDGRVPLPESKQQLARLLGVSRASLFRELGILSREGVIAVTDHDIRICQPERLFLSDTSDLPFPENSETGKDDPNE